MNIEEKNQAAAILKAAKTSCTFTRAVAMRPPGGDHIDWVPIVKALKKNRYKGDVVMSPSPPK